MIVTCVETVDGRMLSVLAIISHYTNMCTIDPRWCRFGAAIMSTAPDGCCVQCTLDIRGFFLVAFIEPHFNVAKEMFLFYDKKIKY